MHLRPQNTSRNAYPYISLYMAAVVIFADTGIFSHSSCARAETLFGAARVLVPLDILRSTATGCLGNPRARLLQSAPQLTGTSD